MSADSETPQDPGRFDGAAFDLVVVGGGPAGEKGAAQAAYFGKRVAIIEAGSVGGTVRSGTLPSKALRETALYLSGLRSRGLYGIDYSFHREISADDLFFRERAVEQTHLELVHENIDRHNIDLIHGTARLESPHTVRVSAEAGSARLRGEFILLATGSRTARPAGVPFDSERVFDIDSILHLERIPPSLVIIGAGVIGCEYASLFAALGTRVTLVDSGARLLPFIDSELTDVLAKQMQDVGVNIIFGHHMQSIETSEAAVGVTLDDGSRLATDAVLYAAGRVGNTEGLGLEGIGIEPDARGRITVDEHYCTSVPSVLAAGDVIGFPALASTAMEQARVAVCHAFGFAYKRQMSSLIPYGIYTIPEVSMIGASEDSLRATETPYLVGRGEFRRNSRAQIMGDNSGLIKLLFEPASRRLLGVHIIGERASELIHVGQMVMQFDGTIDVFIDNVFNFPTLSDAYKYAAYDGLQALERYNRARAITAEASALDTQHSREA